MLVERPIRNCIVLCGKGDEPHIELTMIQLLLTAGADVTKLVETPSSSYESLKNYISVRPSLEVLKLLIESGLNLSVRDPNSGDTLLHLRVGKAGSFSATFCTMIHEWDQEHTRPLNENNGDNNNHSFSHRHS